MPPNYQQDSRSLETLLGAGKNFPAEDMATDYTISEGKWFSCSSPQGLASGGRDATRVRCVPRRRLIDAKRAMARSAPARGDRAVYRGQEISGGEAVPLRARQPR